MLVSLCPAWANIEFGQHRPILAESCQVEAKLGPNLAKLGHRRPKLGPNQPMLTEIGPDLVSRGSCSRQFFHRCWARQSGRNTVFDHGISVDGRNFRGARLSRNEGCAPILEHRPMFAHVGPTPHDIAPNCPSPGRIWAGIGPTLELGQLRARRSYIRGNLGPTRPMLPGIGHMRADFGRCAAEFGQFR